MFGRVPGAVDRFGDRVDLYDFASPDHITIVDASATWCISCQNVSSWLAGGDDPSSFEVHNAAVRAAVDDGRIRWITFMTAANGPGPTDGDDVAWWEERFGHERIPVLNDPDQHVLRAMNQGVSYSGTPYTYFPSFVVLNERMEVVLRGFSWDAMDYALDYLGEDDETALE